jgi:hypothetical protein
MARKLPFSELHSTAGVGSKVIRGERPDIPVHCPPGLAALMQQCWSQVPIDRPSCARVLQQLNLLLQECGTWPSPV